MVKFPLIRRIPRHGDIRLQRCTEVMMEMPAAQDHLTEATELERIERWRADELIRVGYDAEQAMTLAVRHDIDLRAAASLLEKGCPPDLALRILL